MTHHAVLVTHHGKGDIIAPIARAVGWSVSTYDADTDALGTFVGDVPRTTPPLETAVRKARLAPPVPHTWRLASEGTLDSHHLFGPVMRELVVAIDPDDIGIVVGRAAGPLAVGHVVTLSPDLSSSEIWKRLSTSRLVSTFVTVRFANDEQPPLRDVALNDAFVEDLARIVSNGCTVLVQRDLRAHRCGERQALIGEAARDLFARLSTPCPHCAHWGFGHDRDIPGQPCQLCQRPTSATLAEEWTCPRCTYSVVTRERAGSVDPAQCEWCNP